jgi:hypothetical protein
LALADIIGKNGNVVASAVGSAASGLLSKSVQTGDLKIEPDSADFAGTLQHARAQYFDALVEFQAAPPGTAHQTSQIKLDAARDEYNQTRRSIGLEPIQ